jgi:hypothetical protein
MAHPPRRLRAARRSGLTSPDPVRTPTARTATRPPAPDPRTMDKPHHRRAAGRLRPNPPRKTPRAAIKPGNGSPQLTGGSRLRQNYCQFPPRANTELGKYMAEMPLHGSRAKEQARTDLRVGQPVTSQFGREDLPLLRPQVVPGADRPLDNLLACGQQDRYHRLPCRRKLNTDPGVALPSTTAACIASVSGLRYLPAVRSPLPGTFI